MLCSTESLVSLLFLHVNNLLTFIYFYWLITLSFACTIFYLDFCIHYQMIIIKGMVSFANLLSDSRKHLPIFTHFAVLHSLSFKLQLKEKYLVVKLTALRLFPLPLNKGNKDSVPRASLLSALSADLKLSMER